MPGSRSIFAQLAIVVLCAAVVWLAYKAPLGSTSKDPARVELLPFDNTPPSWDGAYPFVVIRQLNSDPRHPRFSVTISQVAPTIRHESAVNQFEVDLHTGMFVLRQTDLFVPDVMPLVLTRTYRPWSGYARAFGVGANHPYDICPTGSRRPYTYQDLNLEDERQIHFARISQGTSYDNAVFRHGDTSSEFFGAQDAWNGDGWTLSFPDGRRFLFPEAYNAKTYAQGAATDMSDGAGHHIQLKRDSARSLRQLISPSGRVINLHYDISDRILEASDDAGSARHYIYDGTGHLERVTDGVNLLYHFRYQPLLRERGYDPYLMTSIEDGDGTSLLRNEFADRSRVSAQRLADGQIIRYDYLYNRRNEIVETRVTLPNGATQRFLFKDGRPAK